MKCCTISDDESKRKVKGKNGRGKKSKLSKAAHKCKGKHGDKFKKCVKTEIKKL